MDPQNLTLTEILLKLHHDHPGKFAAFYGLIALFVLGILFGIWQLWGIGPRRRRGLRAARRLLKTGPWQAALDQLKRVRAIGSPSASWIKTFDQFEAECLQAAAKAALQEKKFEDALKFGAQAAKIFDEPEHEVRMKVQGAMLQEIRRLFSKHGQTDATIDLIIRTLRVQAPCREASFWQAMCEIRLGVLEAALMHLQVARTGVARRLSLDDGFAGPTPSPHPLPNGGRGQGEGGPGTPPAPTSTFIDPPLYLGAILLRTGQAKESLRFLTEANRMDSSCPFIRLQLGAAIVSAGGDTHLAVRALQYALGSKGLGQWLENPDRAWVEGFPEHRSYVRKLAEEFPFKCPLFGEDMKFLIRQGNLALAQGHFKLNNFQEAAELFDKVLKEGAPSLPVLRGLGLSLAKLGHYDDAFVHLRTAHEMEEVKDRITAGYLALCGAGGKPARPEDKLENIAWAIRLVTQFNAPGDPEWAGILNRIFDEARQNNVPFTNDDQLYLCEHLVSVKATDKVAAEAYHYLTATEPNLMHAEYAWLYCRADHQHDVAGEHALALYALTFANQEAARAFYAELGWSFEEIELMFLRRASEKAPGRYPEILGPEYFQRGEQLLLAKAHQLEASGQRESALQTIEVLVKLSPDNTSAMDRAAGLHYRAGRLEPAYDLLEQWHRTQPTEPLPLVRQALLLRLQGHDRACFAKLQDATSLSTGRRRANIAFLGARLALQSFLLPDADQTTDIASGVAPEGLGVKGDMVTLVQDFLHDCLTHDSAHPHALWCLAAVRWLQSDTASLAVQAKDMQNPDVGDPRYHYLAALCQLLGGQLEAVLTACVRAAKQVGSNGSLAQKHLAVEAGYLAALAHLGLNQPRPAIDALKLITYNANSPTLSFAQALLGNVLFREGRHDEAINAWQALDAQKRQAWGLAEPLAHTMFISALESLQKSEYEQAAEKFRQTGRLGYRDRRLGPLLLLTLIKAGQQAIYAQETAPVLATQPEEIPDALVQSPNGESGHE
jgi:tetratricopeptide (TPR) repeat protein